MTEPKPLPCPHCGAALNEFPDHWQHPKNKCLASGWVLRPHRIPLWNHRAPWAVTRERAFAAVYDADNYTIEQVVKALGGKVEG